MITSRTDRVVTYAILVFFTVIALVPVLGILSTAFASQASLNTGFSLPDGLHWSNFVDAWQRGHFGTYLRSSVLVTVVVVVASAALSTLAAYAFGTMRFPGSTMLFYVFLIGLTLPEEALVIPLYYDLRGAGLTDTYWALILPQTAQSIAFGTFWMRTYFLGASRSMVEAARIDGCSSWTTLWRVLVPVGRPAITTMVVITFMWTWNEFLLALVMVTSESRRTVPLGLVFFQGQHSSDISLLAAGAVLVALPVVLVYIALQRKFIEGMLSGAVKE
ncbi:carbohydrate ABC transporter permease [Segeticoccus rhizosphaerae]|uniref:carbohydrate ABC transporter permease n=1 Tax=Segeticoccus rhizosphaerae TaxID=1104777 RepID=UPI001939D35A|nr:carbohydrate ABC transporter permease [Segeticoccus rhizosphaerae]